MSKRIVALVNRGMTDKTAAIVWEHEVPILEAIHGDGQITVVDSSTLADRVEAIVLKGSGQLLDPKRPNVRIVKGDKGGEEAEIVGQIDGKPQTVRLPISRINAQELVARGLGIGEPFKGDPEAEYDRLMAFYGMHTEVKVSVVEYVYGRLREGRFQKALGIEDKVAA